MKIEFENQSAVFRQVFLNPPDIGGRYSALSLFALVPAALLGVDLRRLLASAAAMTRACRAGVADNPGVHFRAGDPLTSTIDAYSLRCSAPRRTALVYPQSLSKEP